MFWFGITTFLTVLVDVFSVRLRKGDKEIEVLLLRQQVWILERKFGQKARINRWEKCLLVVLAVKLMQQSGKVVGGGKCIRAHSDRNEVRLLSLSEGSAVTMVSRVFL